MAQEQLTQIVNLIARAEKAERERDEARAELEEIEAALVAAGQYRLVGDDTTRAGRIAWLKEDCRRLHKEKLDAIYGEGGRNSLRTLIARAAEAMESLLTTRGLPMRGEWVDGGASYRAAVDAHANARALAADLRKAAEGA